MSCVWPLRLDDLLEVRDGLLLLDDDLGEERPVARKLGARRRRDEEPDAQGGRRERRSKRAPHVFASLRDRAAEMACELDDGPRDAAVLEHRARELLGRPRRQHLIEEPLIRLARQAHERQRRWAEVELEEAPALDGAVVVVALLLGLGEDVDLGVGETDAP